ncbi:MAG TPA: site-2 protease family protein [Candidatus Onthoplasma faecipullorum]|nr:site-2 protease family protein [Candidatus Onthoplasma faecipullorum]
MLYYILFSSELTAQEAVVIFLITIVAFFVSLSVHEFAHGFTAVKMGDPTPKLAGRVTLNPFKHISLSGLICFALLGVGWAKPMPINPLNFKKYRKGIRLTSIAGILANFILGLICAIIFALIIAFAPVSNVYIEYILLTLQYFMLVNSFLALFNILPIYPLDGFNFVTSFMKADNKFIQYNVRNGFKILLGILLATVLIDLLFGFDILDFYLSLIYNYIYMPIGLLGV